MEVRTEPDYSRQLPSGRLIRLDVAPMIALLRQAKKRLDPTVLSFVDDFTAYEDYFRVVDLGQCPEVPDTTRPTTFSAPSRSVRHSSWTLAEVLRGESTLSEFDVKALRRSLGWGPMAGWMTKMINAVAHIRDTLKAEFAHSADREEADDEATPPRIPRRFPPPRE